MHSIQSTLKYIPGKQVAETTIELGNNSHIPKKENAILIKHIKDNALSDPNQRITRSITQPSFIGYLEGATTDFPHSLSPSCSDSYKPALLGKSTH